MTSYKQKLLDPRWQKKRLEILNRDNFTCLECGDKEKTLHVHHVFYKAYPCDPWDCVDESLKTLCCECHEDLTADFPGVKKRLLENIHLAGFWQVMDMDDLAHAFSVPDEPLESMELHLLAAIIGELMHSRNADIARGRSDPDFARLGNPDLWAARMAENQFRRKRMYAPFSKE